MNHVTDTTATTTKTTSRRSSRPKASNQQEVATNVNPTSKEDATMTTSSQTAEATFADATSNTGTTEGTAPASNAPEAPKTDAYIKVRVFVLATTQEGTPEFFTAIVGTTAEEVAAKKHHGRAARKAANEGYKWPMTVFDENSTAARQLEVMAGRQRDAMNRA